MALLRSRGTKLHESILVLRLQVEALGTSILLQFAKRASNVSEESTGNIAKKGESLQARNSNLIFADFAGNIN